MQRNTAILFLSCAALVLGGSALAATAPGDPVPASRFFVEIDGIEVAGFTKVTGVGCETEVVDYREGNEPTPAREFPGVTECGPVTLERGLTGTEALADWYEQTKDGKVQEAKRDAAIVVLDREGNSNMRFELHDAWPAAYELGTLDANGGGTAVERLVLAVEDVQRTE